MLTEHNKILLKHEKVRCAPKEYLQKFLNLVKKLRIEFCNENNQELTEEIIYERLPFGLGVRPSLEPNYLENCLTELKENNIFIRLPHQDSIRETFDLTQFIHPQSSITVYPFNGTNNEPSCSQSYPIRTFTNLINDTIMEVTSNSYLLFTGDLIDFSKEL